MHTMFAILQLMLYDSQNDTYPMPAYGYFEAHDIRTNVPCPQSHGAPSHNRMDGLEG